MGGRRDSWRPGKETLPHGGHNAGPRDPQVINSSYYAHEGFPDPAEAAHSPVPHVSRWPEVPQRSQEQSSPSWQYSVPWETFGNGRLRCGGARGRDGGAGQGSLTCSRGAPTARAPQRRGQSQC